jgi:hypothetical protein
MIAHGFTVPQMVELVRTGLATAHTRRAIAGRRTIEIAWPAVRAAARKEKPCWARGSCSMRKAGVRR